MAQKRAKLDPKEVWIDTIINALGLTDGAIVASARESLLGQSDEYLKNTALDAEANGIRFLESFN